MHWLFEYFPKEYYFWHKFSKLPCHLNAAATDMFLLVKYARMYSLKQFNYCADVSNKIQCSMQESHGISSMYVTNTVERKISTLLVIIMLCMLFLNNFEQMFLLTSKKIRHLVYFSLKKNLCFSMLELVFFIKKLLLCIVNYAHQCLGWKKKTNIKVAQSKKVENTLQGYMLT